jgi:hypothetical protein
MVRFLAGVKDFPTLHSIQRSCGAQSISYPVDIGGPFPMVKQQGYKADNPSPTSAKVKKVLFLYSPHIFMM